MIEDGSLRVAPSKSSQWDVGPASRIPILQLDLLLGDNKEVRL